jgi:putative DNA primase/helicase
MVDEHGTVLRMDSATEYMERRSTSDTSERNGALVQYLVLPEAWRNDVCKGFPPDRVAAVLRDMGLLKHDAGKLTSRQRLPGMPDRSPCYVVLPKIFEVEL